MNRLAFLGFLGIITGKLKGQTTITPCQPKIQWGNLPRPCNGQCPNPSCDYMAPPWQDNIPPPWQDNIPEGPHPTVVYLEAGIWPPTRTRIIRCPKCSIAFFQDHAETSK